jgi:hypothetical protein
VKNKDSQTSTTIVVICNDEERYMQWGRVLLGAGADRVVVKRRGELGRNLEKGNLNRRGDLITWAEVPNSATAILVHSGDSDELWDRTIVANKIFWFDSPGSPSVSGSDIPILVPTAGSDFRITETDAGEIIAFSLGKRSDLPACCIRKTASRTQSLPAIYLVLRAIQASPKDESAIRQAWEAMDSEWKLRLWTNALKDYEKRGGAVEKWSAAGLPDSKSTSLSLPGTDMVNNAIDVIKRSIAKNG